MSDTDLFRPSFLQSIYEVLDLHPHFRVSDFVVKVGRNGDENPQVVIKHRKYFFRFTEMPGTGSVTFFVDLSPGVAKINDHFLVDGPGLLPGKVANWIERLVEDLAADPMVRATEARLVAIDQKLAELGAQADADAHFTAGEIFDVRTRLDDLEAKIAEQIKARGDDQRNTNLELTSLHKEIADLKARLSSTTKGQWRRDVLSHLWEWLKEPTHDLLIGLAVDYVKDAATEIVKGLLK
jgi:hypothetical protein